MVTNNRKVRLLTDVIFYGASDLLPRVSIFFLLPIYTRRLSVEDYALWSLIVTFIAVSTATLQIGGDVVYGRFFFEMETTAQKQRVTSTWIGFLTVWTFAVALAAMPFAKDIAASFFNNPNITLLVDLALLSIPIGMLNVLLGQTLRNQFKVRAFATLNIIMMILTLGGSIFGFVVLNQGLVGIIGGNLAGFTVSLVLRIWSVRSMLRPLFSWTLLLKMLKFGVPLMPVALASWVLLSSDRVVLSKLSTAQQLGWYVLANVIANILMSIYFALGHSWTPHALTVYNEQPKEAPIFFGQVLTLILIGFGGLCVVVSTYGVDILTLLATPAYYPAAIAIGPLALAGMAYSSLQVTTLPITISKKAHYFLIISWLVAIFNIIVNIIFVPHWGLIATSWNSAISYTLLSLCYLVVSQRLYPIRYEVRKVLLIVGATLLFTVLTPLLPNINLFVNVIYKMVYCLAYVFLLIVAGVIQPSILKALPGLLNRFTARAKEV